LLQNKSGDHPGSVKFLEISFQGNDPDETSPLTETNQDNPGVHLKSLMSGQPVWDDHPSIVLDSQSHRLSAG